MAWVKLDDEEFQAFAEKVNNVIQADTLKKELGLSSRKVGAKALQSVKRGTPVDTGTLRRSWYMEGPYISGMVIAIKIYNNKEYASFVEDGHRTRGGSSWVSGIHMLYKTVQEVESQMPELITPALQKFLKDLME